MDLGESVAGFEAAWQQFQMGAGLPLICGGCRDWYAPPQGQTGCADAEGLQFKIGGRQIAGEDLNICPACALLALTGKKPFRRKGLVVSIRPPAPAPKAPPGAGERVEGNNCE